MCEAPHSVDAAAIAKLASLARRIDHILAEAPGGFYQRPRPPKLPALAQEYAALAWESALRQHPVEPSAKLRRWSRRFLQRCAFIVGAPRSGTSLLRNLLDGHPQVSVLPCEGNLHTNFEPRMRDLDRPARMKMMGEIWTARLIHSDSLPPYWLLGRHSDQANRYVEFCRRIQGWGRSDTVSALASPYDAFIAVILSWTVMTTQSRLLGRRTLWAEKSPLQESHVDTIVRSFPMAKFIHVVRNPVGVLASRRTLEANVGGRPADTRRYAIEIGRSLRLACRNRDELGPERYRLIRYEDLISDSTTTIRDLCGFLGVSDDEADARPTVAGRPAAQNSSYCTAAQEPGIRADTATPASPEISTSERRLLRRYTGKPAAVLGYSV